MAWTSVQKDEVIFVAFGKENAKEKSLVVEKDGYLEEHVTKIAESETYKKVYTLKVAGQEKDVVVTGKTLLIKEMERNAVKEGDLVRITFLGMFSTSKGKKGYNIKVEVDRA
jgi:ribosomal protein L25 (general stress protein Ctc)